MVLGFYDITPYFHLPDLITVLIIPTIMLIVAIKFLLDRLKFFSPWVHLGIACVIGVLSLPAIVEFSFFVTRISGFSYGPTKIGLNVKGIVTGVISMAVTWIVLPIISDLIPIVYF